MKQFMFVLFLCVLLPVFACTSMKSVEDDMVKLLEHMEVDSLAQKSADGKKQGAGQKAPMPASESLKTSTSSARGNHSLTVQVSPKESTIKVMNIQSRYYPGIRVPSGKYDILVEHSGYKPYREWVDVEYDLIMKVILKKTEEAYMTQSFDPDPPASALETEIAVDAEASPGGAAPEIVAGAADSDAVQLPSLLSGHYGSVSSLCFSPDGSLLASGGYDERILLWNIGDASVTQQLNHEDRVTAVAFSPDGEMVASGGSDGNIKLWAVDSGELLKTMSGHTTRIHSIAFNLTGAVLISGGDNELILWDVDAGKIKTLIVGDDRLYPVFGAIRAIAVHPKGGDGHGHSLAFTCNAGVAVFNPETKELHTISDTAPPYSLTYSSDGTYITWGARHYHKDEFFPRIVISETMERDLALSRDDEMAKADRVFYTRYTPDGGRLIMLTYNQAVLYDVKAGTVIRKFSGTSETAVTDAALSPDGHILAASAKTQIRIWKIDE